MIASKDGRILTNQHVVDRAEKVTVSVPGRKKKYPARIIGTDPQTDIAVLRIESDQPFPKATFSKQEVRVGQWVLAVGNPYGLDGTVSFGIVSAKGRNLELPDTLNDFIQTDAMERISDQSRFLITAGRGDETKFLLVKRGVLPTLPEEPESDAEKASHPRSDEKLE